MEIRELTEQDQNIYTDFVLKQGGSFLQSWQWGEFQKSNNQIIRRFAVYSEDKIVLTAQMTEHKIPHLPGKYLYCAYGPIGNEQALPQFLTYLKENFSKDYWLARLEPQKQFEVSGDETIRIQPAQTLIADLSQTEEELLANMHPKTRYNIKVAQRHNVTVQKFTNPDSEQIQIILNLLDQTSSRHNYSDHPKDYYHKLINSSGNDLTVTCFLASHEHQPLTTAIMIDWQDTRTYLFGGSSDEHKNVMAPYLLHWTAMMDAKTQGFKHYDWWGLATATGKSAGFSDFKQRFGGEKIEYPPAIDVVYNRSWYTIYKVLRKINRIF